MRVTIPIAYDLWVTSTRTGEYSDRRFGHVVEADIREIEGWQAPLAARWTTVIEGHVNATVETRWLDDSHWRRMKRNRTDFSPVTAEEFLATCRVGRPSEGRIRKAIDAPSFQLPGPDGKVVKLNPTLWTANSNVPDVADKTMRAALDGYACIDGEIWIRCGEPAYRIVRHLYDGSPLSVTVLALDDEWHAILDRSRAGAEDMYRADRGDVALDDFRNMGGKMEGKPHLEIHLPETIRYKDDETALVEGARKLFEDRKNERLGRLQAKEIATLGLLRQAFEKADFQDADYDDVAERMREYLDAAGHLPGSGQAEAILFRWSTRSIEMADEPSDSRRM